MKTTIEFDKNIKISIIKQGRISLYTLDRAEGDRSASCAASVFLPLADTPFTALCSHSPHWMKPFFGEDFSELPDLCAALLFRAEGRYVCILPLSGDRCKAAMRGAPGGVEIYLFSGVAERDLSDQPFFLIGEGDRALPLMEECSAVVCRLSGGELRLRADREYPEIFSYLGWCSWDAFQIRVSHAGLLAKAREFSEKKVPIGFAILDDMWADIPGLNDLPEDIGFAPMVRAMHQSRMNAFEGDPKRFPEGMKKAVSDLRRAGIPHVGLWFPTTGYWSGLLPDSPAAKMQEGNTVTLPDGRIFPDPSPDGAGRYFDAFCRAAKDFGCDFVKIDNQSFHKSYEGLFPIGESAKNMQTAIDSAVFRYFDGRMINCMGMGTECMFHRPRSAVSRCSDDFIPESCAWFAKNILECSFNGLLQGRFYVNDWDMFWTDDGQAEKNALCHAVSGGPIYLSDKLGRTVAGVLTPLIFRDGRILRCDDSAVPTEDCLLSDPTGSGKPFKIRNRIGDAAVVAAFDLSEDGAPVSGSVSPEDADLPDGEYLLYEYFGRTCERIRSGDRHPFTLLSGKDLRYFSLIPYHGKPVAVGRTDKFNSRAAILKEEEGCVTLAEGGPTAIFSPLPLRFFSRGRELCAVRRGDLYEIDASPDDRVIEYQTI